MATAGPQLREPDLSGHCGISIASARCHIECQKECLVECQRKCQNRCQIECQIRKDRMSEYMSDRMLWVGPLEENNLVRVGLWNI